MKKLLVLLVTLTIVLSANITLAFEEGGDCTLPKNTVIGIWLLGSNIAPAQLAKDTPIKITKITRDFPDPKDANNTEDVGEFSLMYDKPDFFCKIHGFDPYETYKLNLWSDIAIFMLKDCKQ